MRKILKKIVLAMLILVMLWVAFNMLPFVGWLLLLRFKVIGILLAIVLLYALYIFVGNKLSNLLE